MMPTDIGRIVVGVDDSPASVAALRFAVAEARAHGADLRAVIAWHLPPGMYSEWMSSSMEELAGGFERDAKRTLTDALEELGPETQGVEVEPVVLQGRAAAVLLEEAGAADLLVVGSRGRSGFSGLLLGSVSQECAHHASCPITIVREDAATS